uniref:Uncharacterized protein n=1 Tax=Oryza nivara TaxID=4536 RepID=A0A0E0H825_ORYNI
MLVSGRLADDAFTASRLLASLPCALNSFMLNTTLRALASSPGLASALSFFSLLHYDSGNSSGSCGSRDQATVISTPQKPNSHVAQLSPDFWGLKWTSSIVDGASFCAIPPRSSLVLVSPAARVAATQTVESGLNCSIKHRICELKLAVPPKHDWVKSTNQRY